MPDVFFIGDTHFGHQNILNFSNRDGTPLRPFSTMEEMHESIVLNWNSVVKPQDKVYHLGDVAFSTPGLKVMGRLNGKKRLIRGNHDLYPTKKYMQYFQEIYGVRQIDGYWLTHVPMHPDCLEKAILNIHGHLHSNIVMLPEYSSPPLSDDRYFNVSVEQINYTPVSWDEIKARKVD